MADRYLESSEPYWLSLLSEVDLHLLILLTGLALPIIVALGMFSFLAGMSFLGYVLNTMYRRMGGTVDAADSFDVLVYTAPVFLPWVLLQNMSNTLSGTSSMMFELVAVIVLLWAISVQVRSHSTVQGIDISQAALPYVLWLLLKSPTVMTLVL